MTELHTYTYYLNGLNCASCTVKIEEALKNHKMLSDISYSFATKRLKVSSSLADYSLQNLIQNIVDSFEDGVTVDTAEKNSSMPYDQCSINSNHSEQTKDTSTKKIMTFLTKHRQVIVGAFLLFVITFFTFPFPIEIVGFITSYVLIGGDVATRAIKNLLNRELFDENFLMTLATIGAFALGEYTEAVAVMLFYKIGEAFQDYAVDHSRKSIKSLLDIKADYANLVTNNTTKRVNPDTLSVNDIILIRVGEKVPVDGIVINGTSTLDTSALTGESMPRSVSVENNILSGSINLDATLTVKVTKTFDDSTVAKILDMVENATSNKAKTEQFITKFAKVYTPIVVLSATLLAIMPPLFGFGDFREWLSRALIFLVISCPCALVLSVPLGFFGGLGASSRQGILIKGGNYLEALNTIDTFVFDKTGTLTKGNFAVQQVTNDETLALAASIEVHSNHPIATSIVAAYGKAISIDTVTDVNEIAGEGLMGNYKGKPLYVGNERLMHRHHISIDTYEGTGTIVHVAYDHVYLGSIHIADEIKPNVTSLSTDLKSHGAKEVIMLTGDQKRIANEVATKLNLDRVYSELLPADKLTHVEALIDNGRKVLFVGDGINDAPVLARAHIGVAMGGVGSDAAIEAADIVLMTDEPAKLLLAQGIARKTRKIVFQNIIFALTIKLVFLGLGAIGIATMYEAIFADVGVALLAVLNSMRVMKI